MANVLGFAGACCAQPTCNSTRHTPWVAIPTPGHHAQQSAGMQQRCVLLLTSAAFRALPGNSTATNSPPHSNNLMRMLRPCPYTSSMQTHCPAWQPNSSVCSTLLPAAGACSALACLCNDWPLLLLDNSNSSSTSTTSSSTPGASSADNAAPDTVTSVLLLLGSRLNKSSASIRQVNSNSHCRSGDSSHVLATAATTSSSMHGVGNGCPPNAPMRRPLL